MLADELDFVVGVDPHRDSHALAVVEVAAAWWSSRRALPQTAAAMRRRCVLADRARTGSACVRGRGHRLVRRRPHPLPHRPRRAGVRGRPVAARAPLGRQDRRARRGPRRSQCADQKRPATPRSSGEREALRALMAAREGAVNAKRAGLCQLRDLLITTPEPLRSELRPLTRARLLQPPRSNTTRAATRSRAARHAARAALGRPPRAAADSRGARARTGDRDAHPQARAATARPARRRTAPGRTDRALLVTPRPDRLRGGLRPTRRLRADPRLLRANDPLPPRPKRRPQLNRALHLILVTRRRTHPPTIDYIERRIQEGKTRREAPAASSATSPATSTAYSSTDRHWRLDKHRSIAGPGEGCCSCNY